MRESGEIIYKKDMGLFLIKLTMNFIKEIGYKDKCMDKENIHFKINHFTKGILNLEKLMVMECYDIKMVLFIRVIGLTNRDMDREYINIV